MLHLPRSRAATALAFPLSQAPRLVPIVSIVNVAPSRIRVEERQYTPSRSPLAALSILVIVERVVDLEVVGAVMQVLPEICEAVILVQMPTVLNDERHQVRVWGLDPDEGVLGLGEAEVLELLVAIFASPTKLFIVFEQRVRIESLEVKRGWVHRLDALPFALVSQGGAPSQPRTHTHRRSKLVALTRGAVGLPSLARSLMHTRSYR